MKFRVTVARQRAQAGAAHEAPHDAVVGASVSATVGDLASALVRAGAGDPGLVPIATHRSAPLTLRLHGRGDEGIALDSGDPLGASGLLSGAIVEPVLESDTTGTPRLRPSTGEVEALNGPQRGTRWLLVAGANPIGRARSNRIQLHDPSVSRVHAILRSDPAGLEIEDVGSANGTMLAGERVTRGRITAPVTIELGPVRLRVSPGPPPAPERARASSVPVLPPPRSSPVLPKDPIELPAPPEPGAPPRFPVLALGAPLILGTVLFLTTRSPLSLLFIALSPVIMIGTWVDHRLSGRAARRARAQEFAEQLRDIAAEVAVTTNAERAALHAILPTSAVLLDAPHEPRARLWTRRRRDPEFLHLRCGIGDLPSRRSVSPPSGSTGTAEDRRRLTEIRERCGRIAEAPVRLRLPDSGAAAVVGEARWAAGPLRALIVQLAAHHSPVDLVCVAFVEPGQAREAWAWLRWLPHADSVHSPIRGPHLVADRLHAERLLTALEALVAERDGTPSRATDTAASGPHIAVLVLAPLADPETAVVDRARLIALAAHGAAAGLSVLWYASSWSDVPAVCRQVLAVTGSAPALHEIDADTVIPLSRIESVSGAEAERFARALAPCVDTSARVTDETDFPRSVSLVQIAADDLLGGPEAVVQRWLARDSVVQHWTPGAARDPGGLEATVGLGSAGPVGIDLRAHGPHALLAGTTGAGKSEFLQTWLLSLAAHYAPDRVVFLMVDYKGGAAFADCAGLPHTVGLVTDLGPQLVRRALISLRAELRTREELLARKGAKDLLSLERMSDPEAPPNLIIAIDEFAALRSEVPEFMDGIIDVAQRGRSLGVHLILATQRPAGVITDQVRANTNLRIGLRMADPAESVDVLGGPEAARFDPGTPGRAALAVGAGALVHLQTAYLGGKSGIEAKEAVEIRSLDFGESAPWPTVPEAAVADPAPDAPADIAILADHIRAAARALSCPAPRRPWLDPLPSHLPLLPVRGAASSANPGATGLTVTVGLADLPRRQQQLPARIALAAAGHVLITGSPGAGKSSALVTIGSAAVLADASCRVYGLRSGPGLEPLETLPNTGALLSLEDRDRVERLIGMLTRELRARTDSRADGLTPIVLLVDGFAAFREAFEHRSGTSTVSDGLFELIRGGRACGIHVAAAAEHPGALPAALAANFPERFAFRPASAADGALLGVPAGLLDEAPPGRGIHLSSGNEVQWSVGTAEEIAALGRELQERGTAPAPGVPPVPERIIRSDIIRSDIAGSDIIRSGDAAGSVGPAAPRAPGRGMAAPFALDTVHLAPVTAPATGMLLVTGPAGSGRTTAIRSLLEAATRGIGHESTGGTARDAADSLLIAPRPSTLAELFPWSRIAATQEERRSALAQLTGALTGTESASGPGDAPSTPGRPGIPGIIVIEDIGGFEGTGEETALAGTLKRLRRSSACTIAEGENATLGSVWELTTALKGARWALALQPDTHDTPSIFSAPFPRVHRGDFPPGRGLLLHGGRTIGIQVGLPSSSGAF